MRKRVRRIIGVIAQKRQMPPPISLPAIWPGRQCSRCQRRNQRVIPQRALRVAKTKADQKTRLPQKARALEVPFTKAAEFWLRLRSETPTVRPMMVMSQSSKRTGRIQRCCGAARGIGARTGMAGERLEVVEEGLGAAGAGVGWGRSWSI